MKRFSPKPLSKRRHHWIACLIGLLLLLHWQPATASPPAQTELPPGYIEYYVQAGDSLFGIAESFGVSVDRLAEANDITDPTYITAGQRLIIPPAITEPIGFEYAVQPGETLQVLGLRYGVPADALAQTNHILRGDLLPLGTTITIPAGENGAPVAPLVGGRPQTINVNDTPIGLAVLNHVSPWELVGANSLPSPYWLSPAGKWWLPGSPDEILDLPSPLAELEIRPLPLVQGHTFSILISPTLPISVTGSFMDQSLTFYPHDDRTVTVAGVHALSEPGTFSMTITAEITSEEPIQLALRLPVVAGEYAYEEIVVPDDIVSQMTAEVVQAETDLLDELFALETSDPLWNDRFILPTSGVITSLFGTRRSYNIPNGAHYHSGTDFGTAIGTPVLAPAAGTVIFAGPLTVRGNVVILDHGRGVMSGYWHLADASVGAGDQVAAGDQIAITGGTGLSTGPHLHWEFRVGGVPVDALQWVNNTFP